MRYLRLILLSLALFLPMSGRAAQNLVKDLKVTGALDLSAATNISDIRLALALRPGVEVQAYSASLLAIANNTSGTLALGNVTLTLAGLSSTPLTSANLTGSIAAARLPSNLQSYNALSGSGFPAFLTGTSTLRTFQASGAGISWTQGANGNADPTVALSAQLQSLAGAGSSSINLTLGATAHNSLTLANSGGTAFEISTGHGAGGLANELGIIAGDAGRNAVFLTNTNIAGFPGMTFRDYLGHEVAGIGYANPSASVFAGMWGMEVSDASNAFSGVAPRFYISSFSNFGAGGAAAHAIRFSMETDGELKFFPTSGNAGSPYIKFAKINPTFLFGYAGEISLDAVSGGSEISLTGTMPRVTGGGTLWLRANDDAASIQVRLADGRTTRYSAFGGTLAQGGHEFWTGGAYGSQAERLRISDDGIKAFVPITVGASGIATSQLRHGTATLVAGAATVSDATITSSTRIILTAQSLGTVAIPTALAVTARSAGVSFTITSANAIDTSVIAYEIIEP